MSAIPALPRTRCQRQCVYVCLLLPLWGRTNPFNFTAKLVSCSQVNGGHRRMRTEVRTLLIPYTKCSRLTTCFHTGYIYLPSSPLALSLHVPGQTSRHCVNLILVIESNSKSVQFASPGPPGPVWSKWNRAFARSMSIQQERTISHLSLLCFYQYVHVASLPVSD